MNKPPGMPSAQPPMGGPPGAAPPSSGPPGSPQPGAHPSKFANMHQDWSSMPTPDPQTFLKLLWGSGILSDQQKEMIMALLSNPQAGAAPAPPPGPGGDAAPGMAGAAPAGLPGPIPGM